MKISKIHTVANLPVSRTGTNSLKIPGPTSWCGSHR